MENVLKCDEMKTRKIISGLSGIVLLAAFVWSCENVKQYTDLKDNIPPGKITVTGIENLHGGAMITYALPPDQDLLGVKAIYTLREDGQEYEVYSSAHRDTILLAGFPDTQEHRVHLYAIDQSRNLSEPVAVVVKPLTPPVELVRRSLQVQETFNGVYCSWDNLLNENIAVSLYGASDGEMVLADTYFSSASHSGYSFRGFPDEERAFRIEIRDRWMNYSIPLDTVLTPLFEQQIWGQDPVTGTIWWTLWGMANGECLSRGESSIGVDAIFYYLYDGETWADNPGFWSSGPNPVLSTYLPGANNDMVRPGYYTIDMGRPAVYSRFKKHPRTRNGTGWGTAPYFYEFELWGTNNPKPLIPEIILPADREANLQYWTSWSAVGGTDAWKNDWVKLGEYTVVPPSGVSTYDGVSTLSPADQAFFSAGLDFEIDPDKTNVPCRYLRFVCKSCNWSSTQFSDQLAEILFFGRVVP